MYARGSNINNCLGLPSTTTYGDFTKVGDYDVKKIVPTYGGTLLLCDGGELYHTGMNDNLQSGTKTIYTSTQRFVVYYIWLRKNNRILYIILRNTARIMIY